MAQRRSRPADAPEARASRVVEECYDEVYAYCRRHARSREDAQDLAQEAFLRFARRYGADVRCERPLAYLISIARNLCIDASRRREPDAAPLDEGIQPAAPEPASETLADSRDARIASALASLDEQAREAVELRFGCDLQVNEVARALGISRFAAMRRIRRAVAAIKAHMETAPDAGHAKANTAKGAKHGH